MPEDNIITVKMSCTVYTEPVRRYELEMRFDADLMACNNSTKQMLDAMYERLRAIKEITT